MRTTRRTAKQEQKVDTIYKDKEPDFLEYELLTKFVSERGKILPRSRTGLSAKNQRKLTTAIKRARYLALLPYTVKPE